MRTLLSWLTFYTYTLSGNIGGYIYISRTIPFFINKTKIFALSIITSFKVSSLFLVLIIYAKMFQINVPDFLKKSVSDDVPSLRALITQGYMCIKADLHFEADCHDNVF